MPRTVDDLLSAGISFGSAQVAPPPPPKDRNLGAMANDTVIELANAAAGGVKAVGDFIVPGNFVSQGIGRFIESGEASQSDLVKAEKQQFRQAIEESEGIGGELGAVGRYVARNPLLTAAQAVGSFALPGAAVKGASLAARGLGLGAKATVAAGTAGGVVSGAALGGGDAAGNAYDLVMQTPIDTLMQHPEAQALAAQGADEAQIRDALGTKAARQASVIPALIGGAGGAFGAERLLAGGARMAGAKGLAVTAGSEAVQEGIEEGSTQYEAQRAASTYNPDIEPGKGVAAAAGMGAVMGGVMGGGVHALTGNDIRATETVPEVGPLSAAANVGTEAKARAVDSAPPVQPQPVEPPPVDPVHEQIKSIPDEKTRNEALHAYAIINRPDVPKGVRSYNSKLLDRHLASITDQPAEQTKGADLLQAQPTDPLQGAMQLRRDEETSQQNLDAWMQRAEVLPLDRAQELRAQGAEKGLSLEVVPHGAGQGYTVVPTQWLAPSMRGEVPQNVDTGLLPMDTAPTGVIRADAAGNASPETGAQRINSVAVQRRLDAQARRKVNMGLTPDVEAAAKQRANPAKPAAAPAKPAAAVEKPAAAAPMLPEGTEPGDILTASGAPFKSRLPASNAAKKAGFTVVAVPGGFVARKAPDAKAEDQAPAAVAAAPEAAQVPATVGAEPEVRLEDDGADRQDGAAEQPGGALIEPAESASSGTAEVPAVLYHHTPAENVEKILREGLKVSADRTGMGAVFLDSKPGPGAVAVSTAGLQVETDPTDAPEGARWFAVYGDIPATAIKAAPEQPTAAAKPQSIADLQRIVDSGDPFDDATLAAGKRLKDAVTKDATSAIDAGEMPVYRTKTGLVLALTPSAQEPGKFQLTRYNDTGAIGDSQYNTIADAVQHDRLDYAQRLSASDAEAAMEKVVAAEAEYQQRRAEREAAAKPQPEGKVAANPFKTFLIRNGIALRLARDFTPGTRERLAMGKTFRKDGMELDALAERAAEQGFIRDRMDTDELYSLIARVANGERVAPMYGQDAEAEMAAMRESRMEEDFIPAELEESGYAKADADVQERVRALIAQAEESGVDAESVLEDVAKLTENATEQTYYDAAEQALNAALASQGSAGAQDRGEAAGRQGAATGRQEEGLTAPTPADVLAQDAQREAERQRQEDGGDKPAPVKSPTRDQIDLLNPQGGIFDAPAESDPFAIEDTRQRRKAVLAILGDGWTASDGIEGSRDLFKKRVGTVDVSLMKQRTVDGNFYVGSYDVKTKRGGNTSSPQTLAEAKAEADKFLGAAPSKQDAAPAESAKPLDHGELSIPNRTSTINAELDRYKAEQAKAQRKEEKGNAIERRNNKVRAKELFEQVWPAMKEKMGARFGEKELRSTLDSMVKWEPAKFIALAEKFQREQADAPAFKRGDTRAPGLSRTAFTAALSEAFGPKVAARLEENGVVIPLEDQNSLPEHVVPFVRDGDRIFGFYDPKTDRTYAVLSNLTPEMVRGLALHEVGVHYGFKNMLGADKYSQVINRIGMMGKAGHKAVVEAHRQAKEGSASARQVPEETLAYLVTNHPELDVVREVIARIKAFLFEKFGIGAKYLTVDDMVALARAAVLHSSRGRDGGGGVPAFSRGTKEPMASRKDVVEQEMEVEGFRSFEATPREDGSISFSGTAKVGGTVYFTRNLTATRREDGTWRIRHDGFETFTGKNVRSSANVTLENLMDVASEAALKWANESPAPDTDGASFSRTVEVNGKRYPVENSKGQPVHPTFQGQVNFWRWFKGSKVTNEGGAPLVVYHGTTADLSAFDLGFSGSDGVAYERPAIFATDDARVASDYARNKRNRNIADAGRAFQRYKNENSGVYDEEYERLFDAYKAAGRKEGWDVGVGANVLPLYLSIQNPLEVDGSGQRFMQVMPDAVKQASAEGRDGVIVRNVIDHASPASEYPVTVYIAFRPEQIKSATGNSGDFSPEDDRVSFSRSAVTGQVLPKTWQAPDESKLDDFIYTIQDKHIDTKRAVQAVRDSIGTIADQQDPYLQEELFHGRAAMATKEFLEKSLRPLLVDMQARGVEISDFEEYLHNRHAERRNVQVAKVNPNMQDGGSGIKTADARAYLAGLTQAKRRAYESLAKRIEQINRETRALLVSSGLEKQTTIDAWEAAYGDEYVPLMREEMDNGTTGIGQGYSVRGSASKRAMGSNRKVADIIANIALQRERTITRAEKRRIGEALYGLVLKAPNDEFWTAIDPKLSPRNVMATQMQLIAMGLDPADAESIAQEPKTRYVDKATGIVHERINPAMRGMDNVLAVRIDGEDKFVFFNKGDERAMRMVTALKNLDADQLGSVMGTVAKMTRWFASVNTQYNPVFGVTNITRDVQTALLNLSSTPLKDHKADVAKHVLSALRGIYIDLRDHRAGKQPSSVWAGLFEEFQREGGATGYRDMYANAAERAEAIADELAKVKQGKAMALGRGIMGWLSDYNETMENAVRLAAYKVGKEQGLSNQQAASLAKNLTVNFNRKGQVALQAGALYAFFNAAVQGSARLGQTMFKDGKLSGAGRKILAGGLLLGSMQALLLAAAGFDEDEPPDFVRERALVIPIGGAKYVAIPMPLGFHVIPNLGRIPTEWAMSGFKNTTKRLAQLVGVFADAFNPIGSAGLSMQTLAPTVLDPLAALAENKDWTGKPIAKKDFNSLAPTAGHTRAKDTATPWARLISYGVNWATGGTDYKPGLASPTPDQIDYLIGQITGGVGREVGKLAQVATSTVSGEELPMHKIPLVGRFIGTTEGQSAEASRFYDNLRELGEHKVEIDGLKKDHRSAELMAYLRDNKEARLVQSADHIQREVSKLQKAKRALIAKGASPDQVRFIDVRITAMMKRLNDQVRALEPA
jgi:hypothetical protein